MAFSIAGASIFVALTARPVDQRLVLAGYRPYELLLGRLLLLELFGVAVSAVFSVVMVFGTDPSAPWLARRRRRPRRPHERALRPRGRRAGAARARGRADPDRGRRRAAHAAVHADDRQAAPVLGSAAADAALDRRDRLDRRRRSRGRSPTPRRCSSWPPTSCIDVRRRASTPGTSRQRPRWRSMRRLYCPGGGPAVQRSSGADARICAARCRTSVP